MTYSSHQLAQLWTKLGGNRAKLAVFALNSDLLSKLTEYHRTAVEQVNHVYMHILQLSNQLDTLQGGVRNAIGSTVPHADGKMTIVPLEVNIQLLQSSMKHLEKGRWKAKRVKEQVLSHAVYGYNQPELPRQ
jgi:hypothetical protein